MRGKVIRLTKKIEKNIFMTQRLRKISKQDLNPQSLRGKKKKDDFDHLKTEDFFLIKDSKDDAKKIQIYK